MTEPPEWYVRIIATKKAKRKNKLVQNWERDTPRCETCKNWQGPIRKGFVGVPYCTVGRFATGKNGLCDMWEDETGTTLES